MIPKSLDKYVAGDEIGIRSTFGRKKEVYQITTVERVTAKTIVTKDGTYWRDNGRPVGMKATGSLESMTAPQIAKWREDKAREEAEAEERRKSYNPADHDDHVQAALRALRDKTRSLCEKLQTEVEHGHVIHRNGPVWKAEFLEVVRQIEESESALKSVGLSTTLKSYSDLCSIP